MSIATDTAIKITIKPSDILKQAKEYISDENNWTKGYSARTTVNKPTDPWKDDAFCFCASGALRKAYAMSIEPPINLSMTEVILNLRGNSHLKTTVGYLNACVPLKSASNCYGFSGNFFIYYNDSKTTTHQDILDLFDRAIQLAESEGN